MDVRFTWRSIHQLTTGMHLPVNTVVCISAVVAIFLTTKGLKGCRKVMCSSWFLSLTVWSFSAIMPWLQFCSSVEGWSHREPIWSNTSFGYLILIEQHPLETKAPCWAPAGGLCIFYEIRSWLTEWLWMVTFKKQSLNIRKNAFWFKIQVKPSFEHMTTHSMISAFQTFRIP